jgi:hypothetical protein
MARMVGNDSMGKETEAEVEVEPAKVSRPLLMLTSRVAIVDVVVAAKIMMLRISRHPFIG